MHNLEAEGTVRRVAVVGTGLIGASWAALFLSRGLHVTATDPSPSAEGDLRAHIQAAWPVVVRRGIAPGASPENFRFSSSLREAVEGADYIQESGPERLPLKQALFAELDAAAAPDVVIASSTSGLKMTGVQSLCRHPERCVVGHPFNPPYLIPLVEVVGGQQTSPHTIRRAMDFYSWLGQKPVHLKKEVNGHAANRLQAALWREALHLVNEKVVSIEEVDEIVSWGPGLRWGVMGPNLLFHLGGGQGGIEHFLDHLSGAFAGWMDELGSPAFSPELKTEIVRGVLEEVGGRSLADLLAQRDDAILALLASRQGRPQEL